MGSALLLHNLDFLLISLLSGLFLVSFIHSFIHSRNDRGAVFNVHITHSTSVVPHEEMLALIRN